MSKTIKLIVISVLILGGIALFIFNDNVNLGSIFAGIAGLFALVKSKLINAEPLTERIETIEQEHLVKREDWNRTKEEYDAKYKAMKARMDYLDYRSAKIAEQISDLDEAEKKALETNANLSDDEILDRLNNL